MSRTPAFIHPDLRESAEQFAALTRGNYPANPADQRISREVSYRDVVARIAAHPDAATFLKPEQLPELSHPEIAAVLEFYPALLDEAIARNEPEFRQAATKALREESSPSQRYALIGLNLVEVTRRYALTVILEDVKAQVEVNRERARMDLQRAMS